ncbi:MAG: DUF3883 domain-containing protein [Clostridia bacterium]|nr:DUF3883 domain-containing protein [Clostridia bacterium]
MFFELHNEKRIAYKQLTDADLGRRKTSNQTHIGLFGDVFTYLPNSFEVEDSMLIYNNAVEFLSLNFDRIENPDGTFRSPKIRKGEKNEVSVVTFIRDRAKECDDNVRWYLFWFGLKGGQPVFFLFNEKSHTYQEMTLLGIELREGIKNRLTEQTPQFNSLLKYLEKILNETGVEIAEELEVIAQTTSVAPEKYREYDMNKAREIFVKIGKEGEFLVERYFAKLKETGEIINYKWLNEEKESGLPYDFYLETKVGEIIYLDVKTTNYKFAQKMIFSSQEINFAISTDSKYYIYRVYVNENGERCVKICTNAKELFMNIHNKTVDYESTLLNVAKLESVKLAILPTQETLKFGQQIVLPA